MACSEDDLLPISALQHLVFCERQWGLIHLEQIWAENRLTLEGKHLHERVDESETESRGGVRTARALALRSLRLGLSGRADVVEFLRMEADEGPVDGADDGVSGAVALPGVAGLWRPFPVEYKRGKPKPDRCDEVQLCAQALCLEEMLDTEIPRGALFYGQPRRRQEVAFDPELRALTESLETGDSQNLIQSIRSSGSRLPHLKRLALHCAEVAQSALPGPRAECSGCVYGRDK